MNVSKFENLSSPPLLFIPCAFSSTRDSVVNMGVCQEYGLTGIRLQNENRGFLIQKMLQLLPAPW